jgi:hypothetical protein
MRTLQDDISRRQTKIAEIARDEARASERIASATQSMSRASSKSSKDSYQREIERQQSEVVRLQRKRADEGRDLARKQQDFAKCNADYLKEQEQEMRKSQDILKRLDDDNRRRASSTLARVSREVFASGVTTAARQPAAQQYSAFISHATEDKDEVARPLAEALRKLGHNVWYDEFTLKVGDSLRRSIDAGLAKSRFGIVVLSPSFFEKGWPQYELDGLVAKEQAGQKVILPLWHRISKDDVLKYSPTLADRVALSTATYTIEELATKLHEVIGVNANN